MLNTTLKNNLWEKINLKTIKYITEGQKIMILIKDGMIT